MSGEIIAINASLLAVYDHTQRKKEAFVTSNRVEFELTHGLSANSETDPLQAELTPPIPGLLLGASGSWRVIR